MDRFYYNKGTKIFSNNEDLPSKDKKSFEYIFKYHIKYLIELPMSLRVYSKVLVYEYVWNEYAPEVMILNQEGSTGNIFYHNGKYLVCINDEFYVINSIRKLILGILDNNDEWFNDNSKDIGEKYVKLVHKYNDKMRKVINDSGIF